MRFIFKYLPVLVLVGCSTMMRPCEDPNLASINLINRDGLSETISNPERLKLYQNVDFLCSQPYQKVLRVYQRNDNGDVKSYVTSYHPNGQIKQFLEILNGRAYGNYQEWYEDGILKVDAFVIGGEADIIDSAQKTWLFDGVCKAWDEKGILTAEIPYEKGQLHGVSTYYHKNGHIWKLSPFERGLANGAHEIFQENDALLQTTTYCNGIREGKSIRYWDGEKISADEFFSAGKLISGRYYNFCGELVSEINEGKGYRSVFSKDAIAELQEYHQGILEGEIKVFARNQRIARLYHVKNNVKHGEEVEYFERISQNGQPHPKLSVNWFEGKIQGITKTWYDNGILESKRELSNNVKSGLATAWYRDGQLMLIEEYDHNKLMRGEYYKKGERTPVSNITNGKGVATLFDAEGNFIRRINYHNSYPDE